MATKWQKQENKKLLGEKKTLFHHTKDYLIIETDYYSEEKENKVKLKNKIRLNINQEEEFYY
ncbi:hypothetical protein DERP_010568 [Dermatophagoides pteronyssinus]|uniref:Uncharacterized protein n=1 Tax=Dermatophagoides pteronyssinus TaxID=6956 RepID=A0ABQ8JFM3_DERPT|nr:hypothetical protein DERP_010568 [Dermatophagoides pteronyssinus]